MNKNHFLLNEVAKAIPCKAYQIAYLITTGVIEEPTLRINNKRIFTAKDVDRIREIFQERTAKARRGGSHAAAK
jgi:DNA-binding transcriptional MerR regulator